MRIRIFPFLLFITFGPLFLLCTQPSFREEFPNITVAFTSLRFDLSLAQNGNISFAMAPFNSSNSAMSANKSNSLISYADLIAFSNLLTTEVTGAANHTVVIHDLTKKAEYILYYAGINKETPALYTAVYSQMIKTKGGLNMIFGIGLLLISFFLFFV